MKKISLLFSCILFFHTYIFSQPPGGSGERPAIGKISGTVMDGASGQPLEYSSVVIRGLKDTTKIFGSLVDEKGKFEITAIPLGGYRLTISFVGYKDYVVEKLIVIPPDKIEQNLGTIKVQQDETLLQEVNVTAEKSVMQLATDKKVFNVDKSALTSGGSATDVLKQVPTVDVDVDGNISMRGTGNVTVFINGKPSGITGANKQAVLDAIPASTIESVEILNNPGAKYDAQGEGGIINLVLKKNVTKGFNGNVSAGYTTRYKANAGLSLNFRKNKINLSTNYGFRFNEFSSTTDNKRENISPLSHYFLNTFENSKRHSFSNTFSANLDYNINDKNSLSFNTLVGYNYNVVDEVNNFDFIDTNALLYRTYNRFNNEKRKNINTDAGINYRRIFKSNANDLNIGGNYSYLNSVTDPNYREQRLSVYDDDVLPIEPALSHNHVRTVNHIATFQVDFVQPFEKAKGKLETGIKISYRNLLNDFDADSLNRITHTTEADNSLINSFRFTEDVNAAYLIYGGSLKKFSYKAGVRFEQANIKGIQEIGNQINIQHYYDFFPSVFLSQKLPKNHELQLAYRRSINRPHNQMLNPFGDYSNPLSIRKGNPNLKPAYTEAVEITYLKSFDKGFFISATGYFRYTKNFFTRFINVIDSVSIVSFGNLTKSQNTGLEVIARATITKWWNVMLNVNLYKNKSVGNIPSGETDASSSSFQWNLRLMSNMTVWKTGSLQLMMNYRGKIRFLQGYITPGFNASVGFKEDFLKKNKASIGVNIQDIFHTQKFHVITEGPNFKGDVVRKWQSTTFNITFTYKFGKNAEKVSAPKKKPVNNTDDSGVMEQGF
jgi:outer membrane receptor protein involved in Fe transport